MREQMRSWLAHVIVGRDFDEFRARLVALEAQPSPPPPPHGEDVRLGDVVSYVDRTGRVLAALVTDVGVGGLNNLGVISLCVFRREGSTYGASHVPFDGGTHSWHFRPASGGVA